MNKLELRRHVVQLQRTVSSESLVRNSLLAQQRLIETAWFTEAERMGCYLSMGKEVGTGMILKAAFEAGKVVAVPKYFPETGDWFHCCLRNLDEVATSDWGVPEPGSDERIDRDSLDLVVVPGVAFDVSGNRVGRGKGHYDALLKAYVGKKIGMAYEYQIFESVPSEAHDVAMDVLVSPQKTRTC